jgi:hypothetical protein
MLFVAWSLSSIIIVTLPQYSNFDPRLQCLRRGHLSYDMSLSGAVYSESLVHLQKRLFFLPLQDSRQTLAVLMTCVMPVFMLFANDNLMCFDIMHGHQAEFRDTAVRALNVAARNGHVQTVRVLLEADVDVNGRDDNGNSPVHSAVIEYVCRIFLTFTRLVSGS